MYGTYSDLGHKDRGEGGVYVYGTYSDSGYEAGRSEGRMPEWEIFGLKTRRKTQM